MKIINKFLLILLIITNVLIADDFSIDSLLNDIEKKTDLSEKTKLANAGVSFIYTRDDINRMQIKNLKDILKSTYPLGYNENKYGVPDPLSRGSNHPFLSTSIKVFIDNQEISTGLYGSGLFIMGDINIQWVDHIEVYTQAPTYEYATESTSALIKLYTKSAKKDEGGKIELATGSYGASHINTYHAKELDNKWSYFSFLSRDNNKRKKYFSNETEISRDVDRKLVVTTFNKDNQNILFTAMTQQRDGFLDISIDGSPETSVLEANYIHLGYDTKTDNISYLLTYDYMNTKTKMTDNVTPLAAFNYMYPAKLNETASHSNVFTGEVKYKTKVDKHNIMTGIKYRAKKYIYDKAEINGKAMRSSSNDLQTIATVFIEDQYALKENSIITAGGLYSFVRNNDSIQDDNMFMYRLGHTYTTEQLTFKTIASHTLMTLDSYLVNSSTFLANPRSYYKPQETDTILENIIYKENNNKYELILDYSIVKNYLVPNVQGKLDYNKQNVVMQGINSRWTHNYNKYDKLFIELGYREINNVLNIGKMKNYLTIVKNINTYKRFDIFNEILHTKDNIKKKDFYDYSAGVKYNYSEDFTISLKGINLLSKARTTTYRRANPANPQVQQTPLEISPIDKKIMLSMEYLF